MKSNKLLVKRINKLIENKSNVYKRKFYILGRLSESKVSSNEELLEETVCLIKALNRTQGTFPTEDYLYEHAQKAFENSGMSSKRVKSKIKAIKETVDLKFNSKIVTSKSMILEELSKIKISDAVLDKKLENTLIESYHKNISLVKEQGDKKPYFILDDMPNDFDPKDPRKSLSKSLKKKREEELETSAPNYEELLSIEDEEEKDYSTKRNTNVEVNLIIDKYSFLFDKKNIPMIKNDLKIFLPTDSNWSIEKLNKNDKLYIITMYRLIKEQNASDVAVRKFLMLDKIRTYLNVRSRFVDSEIASVGTGRVVGPGTRFLASPTGLSQEQLEEFKIVYREYVSKIGPEDSQHLSSDIVTEEEIAALLFASAGSLKDDAADFVEYLNMIYPQDPLDEEDIEEILSAEEMEELERQNKEFDERSDERFDGEDQDDNFAEDSSDQGEINIQAAYEKANNLEVVRMSIIDFKEYMEEYNADLERLRELNKKLEEKKPDIFAPFEFDTQGNIIYDGEEETIPAEDLTDQEKTEYENILSRISISKKIEIVGLDRRAEIYDQMYERGATPEEFAQFMKSFGLSKEDKSKSYADISRSSFGDFRGTPAARQFALKAWFKGNYYSLNPKEKARIYAELVERWVESLTKLDLIEDEAFEAQGLPKMPKLNAYYNKIPRFMNLKTLESYFDVGNDENLDMQVSEKIESLMTLVDDQDEFREKVKELEKTDPLFQKYALLETLLNGTSGFRIFATTMLKEFYNDYILVQVNSEITWAIKEFFEKYYPGSKIGASLKIGQRPKDVTREEGRDLFNPIIYLAMSAVGLPKDEVFAEKGNTEENQKKYFLGLLNKKGDFAAKVREYTASNPTGGLYGRENNRYNPAAKVPYTAEDTALLLKDIFEPGGFIYKAKQKIRNFTKDSSNEFVTFLSGYSQEKIDRIVINGLAMSHALRKGVDPLNKRVFDKIGEDTVEAFAKYKKDFAPQLTSKDFAEYLEDEYGYETTSIENFEKNKSATTKNMM